MPETVIQGVVDCDLISVYLLNAANLLLTDIKTKLKFIQNETMQEIVNFEWELDSFYLLFRLV